MKNVHPGLTTESVSASRGQWGSNKLTPQETETFWEKLLANFKDPTIIVLLVALVMITGLAILGYTEWYEGVGIAIAVLIAVGVATGSEYKNEGAFQRLLNDASQIQVKVFRAGGSAEIPIDDIVVGDIVLLLPGDKVPADGIVLDGGITLDQASMTGESEPVNKSAIPNREAASELGDLHDPHWVFRGAVVEDGEAIVEITAVGDKTFYGRLAKEMGGEDRETPLQAKLSVLAGQIGKFGLYGGIAIALAFMGQKLFMERGLTLSTIGPFLADGGNWALLLTELVTAVILAAVIIVVAVPEGLPMMVAIVLSLNMRKLLQDRVLVRKLLGIEAAGSLNVLFSDKTGTLTQGQLQVSTVVLGDGRQSESFDALPEALQRVVGTSVRMNTMAVIDTSADGVVNIVGADRTEAALLKFVEPLLREPDPATVVDAVAFSTARKFSAAQLEGGPATTLVKGAPELILPRCTRALDANGQAQPLTTHAELDAVLNSLAERSMRLLALAVADAPIGEHKELPEQMTLVAVVGLRDELRAESREAVRTAREAGVHVVMVTGDRHETACAIAHDAGLLDRETGVALRSKEIDNLSDEELKEILPRLQVVSRAYPTTKSRLVRAAQEIDMVGGMTGDGVNDAAALKRSDVGFSMGSGTEVAKEAGDIVILNDNFSSLTRAVLYGRTLFKSIRKFLIFQLTVNVSAIMVAFLGPFFGFDLPLTMVQLLWINLIMDTLAALAFSGEAALDRYMREKPIPRDAPIISGDMWSSILINGSVISALSIVFLTYAPIKALFHSEAAFMTGFFAFFVFTHNFNKFNARTEGLNLFEHMTKNPLFLVIVGLIFTLQILFTYFGGEVLRTVGLTASEWLWVLSLSAVIIPVDLTRKWIRDRLGLHPVEPFQAPRPAPAV
ncbi:MAG: calcium-translocating P-type ATPase, PMCA-type [Thiohalocapsa sp.]|nr:calcium-translocating P-type ATPase, PMCA-type [Thiohalocapsa sp.]